MNNTDIRAALAALSQVTLSLEDEYIENEGECTASTEAKEAEIKAIKALLTTEGVDSLGRWLKSKEDEAKTLKAEKDFVSRKIEATNNTIDYIKSQIYNVLDATGMEKVKGQLGYSFAKATSVKTSVEKDVLKDMFLEAVEKKLRSGKKPIIPADVTITLGASVKAVPEGAELPCYYNRTESPSCRFSKPRSGKEE